MDPVSLAELAALVVAAAAGATAQRVVGLGFSLVCAPVCVLVLGPIEGVRLANTMSVLVSFTNMVLSWDDAKRYWRDALRFFVPAIVVTPIVASIVRRADADVLSVIAGVATIVSALALATGVVVHSLRGRGGAIAAGALSATMNLMSGLSGPAVAMYGVNAGWEPHRLRGTLQPYFVGLNVLAVAALGPVRPPAGASAALVTAIAVGFTAGQLVGRRLSAATVRALVLVVAGLGGAAAVMRGIT